MRKACLCLTSDGHQRLPAFSRHDPWMVAALLEIWNTGRRLGRQHCPTLKMVWHAAARRGVSLSRRGFHVAVGVASLSAPKKAWKGDPGEDHFFVSPSGEEGSASLSFGVADGVSQVKPADYSRELCEELQRLSEQQGAEVASPQALLHDAWTIVQGRGTKGATTAAVACISPCPESGKPILKTACLGDSGCRVLRPAPREEGGGLRTVFATGTQQHFFNCPFQLGPDAVSSPADAMLDEVTLEAGDCVIVATDGLMDAVFDDEIASTVQARIMEHYAAARAGEPSPAKVEWMLGLDHEKCQDVLRTATAATSGEPQHELLERAVLLEDVACSLLVRSHELAGDKWRDSPLSLVAKDNDFIISSAENFDDVTICLAQVL